MKRRKKNISRGEALFLVIAGLFIGTVFTFGMQYWNANIDQKDAIHKRAIFDSYKERFGRRNSTRGIDVYFLDCEQLYIDSECVDETLRDELSNIDSGTRVVLMIHPNSDTILDMRVDEKVILEFYDVQEKLGTEKDGFFVLGLILYAMALYGLTNLIPKRKKAKK